MSIIALTTAQELEIEAKYGFEFGNNLSQSGIDELEAQISAGELNPEILLNGTILESSQDFKDIANKILKDIMIKKTGQKYAKV